MDVWERIQKIRETVAYHNRLYYENDAPEISDFEYDALLRELQELEREYPIFASPDSPSASKTPLNLSWSRRSTVNFLPREMYLPKITN